MTSDTLLLCGGAVEIGITQHLPLIEIALRLTHEYESPANKGEAFGLWQWQLVTPNRYCIHLD